MFVVPKFKFSHFNYRISAVKRRMNVKTHRVVVGEEGEEGF